MQRICFEKQLGEEVTIKVPYTHFHGLDIRKVLLNNIEYGNISIENIYS